MKAEEIAKHLERYGLKYAAVFVPQSASRNSAEKTPSLNWRIHLSRAGNAASIATDYMQGIGHLPKPAMPSPASSRYVRSLLAQHEKQAAESGKAAARYNENMGGWLSLKPLPAPPLADVLHSLLLDGDAAEYTFEEWAANYDYDEDSRKAEATYNACRETGRQLRRMFSRSELTELQTLFQDY